MSNEIACGRSGDIGSWIDFVQQVSKLSQTCEGNYDAGAYHKARFDDAFLKHSRSIWSYMCKRQGRTIASSVNVELSMTENFWNTIRVFYLWLCRFFWHNALPRFETAQYT